MSWSGLRVIRAAGHLTTLASPVGVEVLAGVGQELVGVGAKVVALCLDQVRWEAWRPIAVIERKCCAECWRWDTKFGRSGNNFTPVGLHNFAVEVSHCETHTHTTLERVIEFTHLCVLHGISKELVNEERVQFWVLRVRIFDLAKEDGPDDAASTPHQRNAWEVQMPPVVASSLAHQHEALGIPTALIVSMCKMENDKMGEESTLAQEHSWELRRTRRFSRRKEPGESPQ